MSKERLLQDYLNDMLESVTDIKDFIKDMSFENFSNDRKTIKAVVRCLEVIGEAANKIPQHVREQYSMIPWDEIIGMRNRLIHEYFGVDIDIIWQTIEEDMSPLETAIRAMLSRV